MEEFTVAKLTGTDVGVITKLKAFKNLFYTCKILAESNLVEELGWRSSASHLLLRVLALWIEAPT